MFNSAQNTLSIQQLLNDLQDTDQQKYTYATQAIFTVIRELDASQQIVVLQALATPFPLETSNFPIRLTLLKHLVHGTEGHVMQVAENLFHAYDDVQIKYQILSILSHRSTDVAMQTFLRLAPTVQQVEHIHNPLFHINEAFYKFLPQIISTALMSASFLTMLCDSTYNTEIWDRDKVREYGLEKLIPGILQLFRERIDAVSDVPQVGEFYLLYDNVVTLISILGRPGMPVETDTCFEELLQHEEATFRVLAACALMAHEVDLTDELILSFLTDLNTGDMFLSQIREQNQIEKIRHLLNQEIVANIFINRCLWERDAGAESIQLVSHLTVRYKNDSPVLLYLSQVTEPGGLIFHVLSGPYAIEESEININPRLFTFLKNEAAVNDGLLLQTVAEKAYGDYLEGKDESEG